MRRDALSIISQASPDPVVDGPSQCAGRTVRVEIFRRGAEKMHDVLIGLEVNEFAKYVRSGLALEDILPRATIHAAQDKCDADVRLSNLVEQFVVGIRRQDGSSLRHTWNVGTQWLVTRKRALSYEPGVGHANSTKVPAA